jgi:hypothetical protein
VRANGVPLICSPIAATNRWALKTAVTRDGIAAPRILRAGEHVDIYAMPASRKSLDLWSKFNDERLKITTRVCYCSVFDECWVNSSRTTQTDRVAGCPTPAVPYELKARP